jgi:hypothetical protein
MTRETNSPVTCRRWLATRLALLLAHTLWVIALVPTAVPVAAPLFVLTTALLYIDRHRAADRLAAWLSASTLTLATLQLTFSESPLVVGLGAAVFASSSVALFLDHRPRAALGALPFIALATAGLASLTSSPTAIAYAVPLALFAMLRPLSALGHLLLSLGLHRGPVDRLLMWDPLVAPQPTPSPSKRTPSVSEAP